MSNKVVVGFLLASFCVIRSPVAALAVGGITLNVPKLTEPVPVTGTDYTADVTFSTGGTSVPLVGYDIAFKITGPTSNLTVTGVSTGVARPANAVFADDPTFSTHVDAGTTVYAVSDFLISGTGTIADGSTLVELKLHAAPGTTGVFAIDFDTDAASAFNSLLYTDANLSSVPNLSLQGGSVTFVPEPTSLGLLTGGILLVGRRKNR